MIQFNVPNLWCTNESIVESNFQDQSFSVVSMKKIESFGANHREERRVCEEVM
jgi:hypothetical protein